MDIVIPRGYWDMALASGLRIGAGSYTSLALPIGVARSRDNVALLARGQPTPGADQVAADGSRLTLMLTAEMERVGEQGFRGADQAADVWQALLVLGCGKDEGKIAAWSRSPYGDPQPVRNVRLPGPGMHSLALVGDEPEAARPVGQLSWQRWSRSIGALGDQTWHRLTGLSFGIVGCGRLGSLIASSLARIGVMHLVLVDPDSVERHNLGEGVGLDESDLGRPKAQAVLASLARSYPWVRGQAVDLSVTRWNALTALKSCDVVFSCAASEGGRLATALLAARYLKVLVDAGTGVFAGENGARQRGAEVQLVIPGEGCLGCLGGVGDEEAAKEQMSSLQAEATALNSVQWWQQRAGSLYSLNQIAGGLAIGLLERLVAGEQRRSVSLRLVWNTDGPPRLTSSSPIYRASQCICGQTGRGDEE